MNDVAHSRRNAQKDSQESCERCGEEEKKEGLQSGDKGEPRENARTGRGNVQRVRSIVRLVVLLSIIVGLFVGVGWGSYSSMGLDAIAYLCPLGALETMLAGHSAILRSALSLVCVLVIVALVGRVFCAWVCPIPPLQHFFSPRASKKKKTGSQTVSDVISDETCEGGSQANRKSSTARAGKLSLVPDEREELAGQGCGGCSTSCKLNPVGGERDGLRLDSRHGVLLGALASSALFGFPVFCLVCPVGLTIAFVVCLYRALFEQDPTLSLLVFGAILLLEVVFFRKWCHKMCPLGALMSLVGAKAPVAKPKVASDVCLREKGVDCRVCVDACPELLDPHSKKIPECTRCGQCVDACPMNAITLRRWSPSSRQ